MARLWRQTEVMGLLTHAIVTAAAMALGQNGLDEQVSAKNAACLALNVYYEARGEDKLGQQAVAHVVLNRVESKRYPDNVCGVVSQAFKPGVCQFSWWCHAKAAPSAESPAFRRSLDVAVAALSGKAKDPTDGAMYFHARRLGTPGWTRGLKLTKVIGSHKFLAR